MQRIDEDLTYDYLHSSEDNLWSVLYLTGYLTRVREEELTDAEKTAYRRGRNAKSFTMPKHATMKDYRMATGFEALMGYLYLTEQFDRMAELLGKGLEQMGELISL